jgi:hypothetical protein
LFSFVSLFSNYIGRRAELLRHEENPLIFSSSGGREKGPLLTERCGPFVVLVVFSPRPADATAHPDAGA